VIFMRVVYFSANLTKLFSVNTYIWTIKQLLTFMRLNLFLVSKSRHA
jgi:hypothetical protein